MRTVRPRIRAAEGLMVVIIIVAFVVVDVAVVVVVVVDVALANILVLWPIVVATSSENVHSQAVVLATCSQPILRVRE